MCLPDPATINISTSGFGGFDDTVSLAVISSLPAGAIATFSETEVAASEGATLTIEFAEDTAPGELSIEIEGTTDTLGTKSTTIMLNLVYNDFTDLIQWNQ